MAVYVLVHGAWRGGWCWREVARLLRAAGHEVFTPTLSGCGERSHLFTREIGLGTHIQDVVNLIEWEELDGLVLVGHSYGGAVITGIADRLWQRIRSIVYVDAFLPADGQSMIDLMGPERLALLRENMKSQGMSDRVPPIPLAVFRGDPANFPWLERRCTPHPLKCFEEKLTLAGNLGKIERRAYVRAANYPMNAFASTYERLKRDPAWRTEAIAAGHDIMVDAPAALVEVLLSTA